MTSTTSTTTTKTTTPPAKKNKNIPAESALDLSANFANNRKGAVGYDHEVYLQLTAGRNAEKTPNQMYREVRLIVHFFLCFYLLFFFKGRDFFFYHLRYDLSPHGLNLCFLE